VFSASANFQIFGIPQVVSPMSITFVLNISPLTGTLIDINISDIFIRLTAGLVTITDVDLFF
jgi:hypothetical protein